ncbi:AAA family ATPase [Natronolimnobius sp. AArcel1]|uniref:AAA family ATPase n=1 Tax=Natronolimnobius sp. AArcel1 TaxID=1679093 RepID=UPI0013EC8D07|nr:AAA family ATPase [Natronolimnobius sp. AArcel1]NGM67475.1 AAA family ATPase [Natronolimnobius sp. AArcel1]
MNDLTPALLTDASALVPGSTAFLAVVLMAGTVAVALRTVSWAVAAQADRLFLGAAYVVGVGGFVATGDAALVFAPPALTLAWQFVGRHTDGGTQTRQIQGAPGDGDSSHARDDSEDETGTALAGDDLETEPPGHDFSDVGGMMELKETLHDRVIDPLTREDVYDYYGIGAVNGVLFHGPPGCGKTFVASALAAETDYNYLEVTPSDITSKYIGEAADNVATLFETARENEPCLVFIDEIDAIAGDRSGRMANSEQQMVNQLLTELESQTDADIVVFAATNYVDDVDDAILRSGRFDERIEIPPPDRRARLEMLRLELADAPVSEEVSLEAIAEATAGYASSDVTLVADVAIRHAIGDESPVEQGHLQQAVSEIDTSIAGWLDRYEDHFGEELGRSSADEPVALDSLPGMEDIGAELERRVLEPVRNPDGYERYEVPAVDGVLLYGPPDAGKTSLAQSLAAELDRPIVELSTARFHQEGVDEPADRAAEIIEDARSLAPCVLMLDDLDELAPTSGGSRATRRVTTRLETLLPTLGDDVLVVATTRSVDGVNIDVLHAGTFDERIEVPPPDGTTRAAILAKSLPDGFLAADIDLETVAEATAGFSIRDVRHLAGRVAREALRREEQITTDRLIAEADGVEATLAGWHESASQRGEMGLTEIPDVIERQR